MKRIKNQEEINDIKTFPFKSIILFFASCILIFLFAGIVRAYALKTVKTSLKEFDKNITITINNKQVNNTGEVLSVLSKVKRLKAHKSHSLDTFVIEIKDTEEILRLNLGRDSKVKNEYWVFYPEYRITSANAIGRIRTDIFDDIEVPE